MVLCYRISRNGIFCFINSEILLTSRSNKSERTEIKVKNKEKGRKRIEIKVIIR